MTDWKGFFISAIAAAIIAFIAILLYVYATGQSFGQRCAAAGYKDRSSEFDKCVRRLSKGDSA